ncbi:MAG TPA: tetratricopeptide repeat protein [Candidatus Paceibacterota bacterium]|nr:tetratricopeptide repeat protein [Verrucomicrobiota bacterium]HSA10945.1 tetratricopeptide repeat protein [Candidatus Paceibacterota bacterium]
MDRSSEALPLSGAFCWLVVAGVLAVALAQPQAARAHGEIHLRILEYTQQIEAATNNPAALYLERGELKREHGLWEEAGADFDRAAQLDPGLPGVDRCRAKLLADRGQFEAARAVFDQAVQRSPDDGECFVGRARLMIKLGQRKAAIADYWRGLERLREPQPEYVVELAQALAAEGDVVEALRALDEGIRKHGPVLPLQGYALDLELGRKNHESALVRLETILARAMRKESWFARRGDILLEAGRMAEARKSYEAALVAVKRLPGRLQQSPSMVKLQAHVNTALAEMANAPPAGQSE